MSDNAMMTQGQIEEMLRNAGAVETPAKELLLSDFLTKDEQDALGEMGNICMGTAATTMYTLLNRQVYITTPMLTLHTWDSLAAEHPLPLVVVEVLYTKGIGGNNLLLLKEFDVALITDLLMGGEGNIDPNNVVLDEISLSAIREVMNQMVGSSATSLAQMLMKTIDISTPESRRIVMSEERITNVIPPDGIILKIAFRMEIEGLLESEIMQIFPIDFAQSLAHQLLNPEPEEGMSEPPPQPAPPPPAQAVAAPPPQQPTPPPQQQASAAAAPPSPVQQYAQPPQYAQPSQYGPPPQYAPPPQYGPPPQYAYPPQMQEQMPYHGIMRDPGNVTVREAEYPSFGIQHDFGGGLSSENLWRLLDVPMEITIELGRSKKTVKQVLDLNVGSVVVLDKLAGELVEVMVNGIQVARGEVVIIDDSYGVRITELNAARINELTQEKK